MNAVVEEPGVIDAKGELPSRERVDLAIRSWGMIPGYVRMFGVGYAALVTGQNRAEWQDLLALEDAKLVAEWRRRLEAASIPGTPEVVDRLRRAGVRRVMVHAVQPLEPGDWDYCRGNDELSELTRSYPDFVVGFANVNIFDGERALAEVQRAHDELGLAGLKITPPFFKACTDDEALRPFYALCEERGILLWLHCGTHWRSEFRMDATHPTRLDRVACDFPKLRIIAGHAGWPWVLDAVVVAWRHKHVYLDISAHRPRNFTKSASGWEPLLQFGNTTVRDKVLFGTSWDIVGVPMEQLIKEVRSLPLKPETVSAWLHGNSAGLLAGIGRA
jgi:uncharacterized protein